jgi:hypothetical protein
VLAHLTPVDVLRQIEFNEALARLQGLIGAEVKVALNLYGQFFGCGFEGALRRVRTLPPDHAAINLELEGGQGLFLDPADAEAFLGSGAAQDGEWLEFRMAFGVTVTVEPARGES